MSTSPTPRAADAPVIVGALRTPVGTAGKCLAHVDAAGLAAPLLRRLADDLPETDVAEVVLGNCMGPGGNLARYAALAAGLPAAVAGLTVDRQCASGLAAISTAAALARETPGLLLAGGTDSASTAPWRFWPPRSPDEAPRRYQRAPFAPAALGDPDMGLAADLLAAERGVTRERQDEYAARSHTRAHATQQAGRFDAETVPVGGVGRDERPRPGMTRERLARLRPTFRAEGTVTAGNACGVNDGAAAVALVDGGTHAALGVPGLRVLAAATAGVEPTRPGLGIVPAARAALERAGVGLDDLDAVELNEAFAGQVLACCDELGLAATRVCPDGGALALGHPWGASGAVLVVRLFTRLVREGRGTLGLAGIAAGGGQGVALVVERC
jgi:acetyl-CoA C-acetyltransferase